MKKDFDLLTLGEVLLRLSPPINELLIKCDSLDKQIGGSELNVACGASLLGLRTGIISKLPYNELGIFAENSVRFNGVSNDYIRFDTSKHSRLGIYFYEYGAAPRKANVFYDRNNSSFRKIQLTDFPQKMYSSAKVFHTSGITLGLSDHSFKIATEMMKKFKEQGTLISFDVNFRANLWDGKRAKERISKILPLVDILFCSKSTAELTFEKSGNIKDILKSFCHEYGISTIASTDRIVHSPKSHTFSSIAYDANKDKFFEEEPYAKIDVVDRIGSGDAYVAGFLYGIISSGGDCMKAVEYGNASSAVKNTIIGDMPCSRLKEIDEIILNHKHNLNSDVKR